MKVVDLWKVIDCYDTLVVEMDGKYFGVVNTDASAYEVSIMDICGKDVVRVRAGAVAGFGNCVIAKIA